jgi:hypothetical protein
MEIFNMNKKVLSWIMVVMVIVLVSWSQISPFVTSSLLVENANYSSTSKDPILSTPKRINAEISGIKN